MPSGKNRRFFSKNREKRHSYAVFYFLNFLKFLHINYISIFNNFLNYVFKFKELTRTRARARAWGFVHTTQMRECFSFFLIEEKQKIKQQRPVH